MYVLLQKMRQDVDMEHMIVMTVAAVQENVVKLNRNVLMQVIMEENLVLSGQKLEHPNAVQDIAN